MITSFRLIVPHTMPQRRFGECRSVETTKSGRTAAALILFLLLIASLNVKAATEPDTQTSLGPHVLAQFGNPPALKSGPLSSEVVDAIDTVFGENLRVPEWGEKQSDAIQVLATSEDPRVAWLVSDMMRFARSEGLMTALASVTARLLNISYEKNNYWDHTVNHLMAWNIPAPPDYLRVKKNIFTSLVPGWDNIFVEGKIDWRLVSWGGVLIDDRPFGTTDEPCNCIPAADNPDVTSAVDAKWLKDDDIIFGVSINGEHRAYPRRIMEVREMVNDTLGGRDLGIPYCTLCGAAQAYFTDEMPDGVERPVLRTSGLLIRSNKVMYDLNTFSVFDTFLGHAVTGPLAGKNIQLKQAGVVTSEWGAWKRAHPDTTVLAESLALGRDFDFRNNRDASGPIFPIGDVDPRLPVQEDILGLLTDKGVPVAFQVSKALEVLKRGDEIVFEDTSLLLEGSGIKAVDKAGNDLGAHQAFWFAWSQFHRDTKLWTE